MNKTFLLFLCLSLVINTVSGVGSAFINGMTVVISVIGNGLAISVTGPMPGYVALGNFIIFIASLQDV